MEIKQRLIPDHKKPKYRLSNGTLVTFSMKPEYIAIHETDNTSKGADADAHSRLQLNGNSRQASWHIQVDDKEAIQSLPFNEAGMHAGDGINGKGNRKSIGVEICVNSDGNYEKALVNAAKVVSQLMKQFNIPIEKVQPHRFFSGKNCPTNLLKGRWDSFIAMCLKGSEDKEEVRMFKPTSATILDETKKALKEFEKEGVFSSIWSKRLDDGELTLDDAVGLLFLAHNARKLK